MKIRQNLFFAAAFLLLLLTAPAIYAQAPAPTGGGNGKVSIWKITDLDNTVYLAGSVHLLRAEDLPLPASYYKVYNDSAEIVFEVDMALMKDPAVLQGIRSKGMLPRGKSLRDHFSENTVRRIQQYASPFGLQPAIINQMKPSMVFITVSTLEAVRLGAKPQLGLEFTFHDKTVKDGKPSRGLETAEFQLSRFDSIEDKELENLLNASLDEADKRNNELGPLIAAWKVGDGAQLDKLISKHMEEGSNIRRLLLAERNQNWIPEIEKAVAGSTNIMFLVGAAHLVGNDSVVQLLRTKGHTVTQMDSIVKKSAAGQ